MKLYRTRKGIVLEQDDQYFLLPRDWDDLFREDDLVQQLRQWVARQTPMPEAADWLANELLPPTGRQEIWGAGVTYYRSRSARMEEAKAAGGGDFYDKVYRAERPEVFFKNTPHRAVGHGQLVRIRRDAHWNVPEPELTLAISRSGALLGYTIGNDMSSRDIEGENPLYLPQAKIYDGSAAIGPGILLADTPLPLATRIRLEIERSSTSVFAGETTLDQLKRSFDELTHYLFRETSFPYGCLLMTGTGIVPPDDFSLQTGDEIRIGIEGIGTLTNGVAES